MAKGVQLFHPLLLLILARAITLSTGNAGLNLQAANHLFLLDPPNRLSIEMQAVGRCQKIGQSRTVKVWKFVTRGTANYVSRY